MPTMSPAPSTAVLADRIRRVRKDLYVTQEEFAPKVGVTSVTVSRWERGVIAPDVRARRALALISRRKPDYFELADTAVTADREEATT